MVKMKRSWFLKKVSTFGNSSGIWEKTCIWKNVHESDKVHEFIKSSRKLIKAINKLKTIDFERVNYLEKRLHAWKSSQSLKSSWSRESSGIWIFF